MMHWPMHVKLLARWVACASSLLVGGRASELLLHGAARPDSPETDGAPPPCTRARAQTNRIKDGEEPGPDTELEFWRTRMSNFNSITEQLKTRECRLALGVAAAAKSRAYARWKSLDIQVRTRCVHVWVCVRVRACVALRACVCTAAPPALQCTLVLARTERGCERADSARVCPNLALPADSLPPPSQSLPPSPPCGCLHCAQVTDAANEAKDNVKYLATLEKSLEPMFNGTVQDITDTIPALLRCAHGAGHARALGAPCTHTM